MALIVSLCRSLARGRQHHLPHQRHLLLQRLFQSGLWTAPVTESAPTYHGEDEVAASLLRDIHATMMADQNVPSPTALAKLKSWSSIPKDATTSSRSTARPTAEQMVLTELWQLRISHGGLIADDLDAAGRSVRMLRNLSLHQRQHQTLVVVVVVRSWVLQAHQGHQGHQDHQAPHGRSHLNFY